MSYRPEDLIGKTLFAKVQVPIVELPYDNMPIIRIIPPGVAVGRIHSWLNPKAGRQTLYWHFKNQAGDSFYARHESHFYDLKQLKDQGVLSIEEKKELDNQKDYLARAGQMLTKGIMLWGIFKIGSSLISKSK